MWRRGNLERELIQWMGRGAGTDGRKERDGRRKGGRKETDQEREKRNVSRNLQVFSL